MLARCTGARFKIRLSYLSRGFSPCQFKGDVMTELKPFLVRLRPEVRQLLELTAKERNKSIAAVINDELEEALHINRDLDTRLSKMLG